MRKNGIVALLACVVGLSPSACTQSETAAISNDAGKDQAAGTGGAGSGGAGSGGAPGSGGTNVGTGGAASGGSGGGSGGAPVDAPIDAPAMDDAADSGDSADDSDDAGTDQGGSDAAADGDGPGATDDAGFPVGAAIGSCFRLNWNATASSSAPLDPPESAYDDLPATRWSTGTPQVADQEYRLDFGGVVRVSQVRLDVSGSPGDFPRGLDVIASPDGLDFTNVVASVPVDNVAPVNNITVVDFPPVVAHTLLLRQTGSSGSWWSIHELGVTCQIPDGQGGLTTDVPADNLRCEPNTADGGAPTGPFDRSNWTLTAFSTNAQPDDVISNAVDGSATTRWSSGMAQAPGQFFKVDLGSTGCIGQITLTARGTDYLTSYLVSVSVDDTTYLPIARGAGANATTIRLPPHNARYVRIEQTGTSTSWWSIDELTISP